MALRSGLGTANLRILHSTSAGYNTVEYAVIVALSVYAFDVGGAAAVGVITVVRTLPALLSGPSLAVAVDRWPRTRVLAAGLASRAVAVGALAWAVAGDAAFSVVALLAAADAMVASSFYPAYGALLPELAGSPNELASSNALASAAENLGTVLGPLLAAAILLTAGPWIVLVASAGLVLAAALLATRLQTGRRSPSQRGEAESLWRGFSKGLGAIRRNRESRVVMGTWAFESVLVGMSEVVLVVIAFDLLGLDDAGVGWLNAVMGLGGLGGAIAMAAVARDRRYGRYLAVGTAAFGLALLVMGALPGLGLVLLAHGAIGVAAAQVDVAGMTLLQRTVPEDELGRILGAFEGIYWGALAVGAALASWSSVALGIETTLIIVGIIGAAFGLVVLPALRRVDSMVEVPADRLELLRRVPLFAALPVPTRERLARRMIERTEPAGTVLIVEGEDGDEMFVVRGGELAVELNGQQVNTVGPGAVVGEIAPLQGSGRTATVTVLTDADLLELDGRTFVEAVCGHAVAAGDLERMVDRRIGQLRRMGARTGR